MTSIQASRHVSRHRPGGPDWFERIVLAVAVLCFVAACVAWWARR